VVRLVHSPPTRGTGPTLDRSGCSPGETPSSQLETQTESADASNEWFDGLVAVHPRTMCGGVARGSVDIGD
jgi:hypothetical protein